MIQQSDKTFATIGEVARSAIPGARVLLFGSHARGQADAESDFDILIIAERAVDIGDKFALRTRIRKQLLERGIRCDILIQSEQEVESKRELPGHIVRSALREGVPLCERRDARHGRRFYRWLRASRMIWARRASRRRVGA